MRLSVIADLADATCDTAGHVITCLRPKRAARRTPACCCRQQAEDEAEGKSLR